MRFCGADAAASGAQLFKVHLGGRMRKCFEHGIHGWKTGASDAEVGLEGGPYSEVNIVVWEMMLAECL